MGGRIGAVIFEGGIDTSPLEHELREARKILTLELMAKCKKTDRIQQTVLVTDHVDLISQVPTYSAIAYQTSDDVPFHFGRTLLSVCEAYGFEKVLTFSGASAPLMTEAELEQIVDLLESSEDTVIANNPQSADIIAFSPACVLKQIALPAIDNPMPWILREEGKLHLVLLPVTAGYNFDLDTPLDLVYLSLHPACPQAVRSSAGKWQRAADRVAAAGQILATPNAEILLSGRIGPWIMAHINEHVRCRLRVVSEERGMKALGRAENNEVYSIFGKLIDTMGLEGFFRYLEDYCDAAFIDTRVLFGHWHLQLDNDDRFFSDLGEYERIKNPMIQELTRQALNCAVPVVLGGHSIVAGGMMVLIDTIMQKMAPEVSNY
jgi:hypothetical protein